MSDKYVADDDERVARMREAFERDLATLSPRPTVEVDEQELASLSVKLTEANREVTALRARLAAAEGARERLEDLSKEAVHRFDAYCDTVQWVPDESPLYRAMQGLRFAVYGDNALAKLRKEK